mmetsp:Transcript_18839/g.30005  ORF Transcript_18839/g.30005 Transcript_18839/m.30005 type:complete len:100 (-) Transcript_18839:1716-2015(-)
MQNDIQYNRYKKNEQPQYPPQLKKNKHIQKIRNREKKKKMQSHQVIDVNECHMFLNVYLIAKVTYKLYFNIRKKRTYYEILNTTINFFYEKFFIFFLFE